MNGRALLRALRARSLAVLSLILAVVGVVTVTVTISNDDNGKPRANIVIGSKNGPKVAVPKAQAQQVLETQADDHTQLGPGNDTNKTAAADDRAASPQAPRINGPVPLASAHQAGCLTRQIPVNYSYRTGIRPSLIVEHLTVSPNVVGWGDANAIYYFFSRSATQASSNYVVDAEGHCILMVPESAKAWAQANFNSATACSIEQINYGESGNESTYAGGVGSAGERENARIVHDCAARWHIPLRRAQVSGCSVVRSGVIDHDHLGTCGGGHNDINPYSTACRRGSYGNTWACVDRMIAAAGGAGGNPPTAHAQALCREYAHYRREAKAHTFPESRRPRAVAVRSALAKAHYGCTASGRAVRR